MAQRTSDGQVRAILGGNYPTSGGISLQPFIDTAVVLVDWLAGEDDDSELSATALERIEAYLSAHFYEHADQIASSKGVGRANASFQGQTAMRLDGTKYGQTAMLLDVTGKLVERSSSKKRVTLSATWLGKPPTEQTDYVDRD